jgi:hypothetical protein
MKHMVPVTRDRDRPRVVEFDRVLRRKVKGSAG